MNPAGKYARPAPNENSAIPTDPMTSTGETARFGAGGLVVSSLMGPQQLINGWSSRYELTVLSGASIARSSAISDATTGSIFFSGRSLRG